MQDENKGDLLNSCDVDTFCGPRERKKQEARERFYQDKDNKLRKENRKNGKIFRTFYFLPRHDQRLHIYGNIESPDRQGIYLFWSLTRWNC